MQYDQLSEEELIVVGNQVLLASVLRIRAQEEKDLKARELSKANSCLTNTQENKDEGSQ